jgi:hypothetical protein
MGTVGSNPTPSAQAHDASLTVVRDVEGRISMFSSIFSEALETSPRNPARLSHPLVMLASMDTETRDLRTGLEKWARNYEPRLLDGPAAARELRRVARMKAICASVETRLARRVEETNAWQRGGHRSAAHFVARETGTSIHQAVVTLQTGAHLEELPAVADAFAAGRVSQSQVSEIAPAAAVAPEEERSLVALAEGDRNQAVLRERCRRVKADGTDALAQHNAVHAARALRTWTDAGGTWHLHANGTPTDGARVMARLNPETETVFAEARGSRKPEEREAIDAYRFDALVRIAEQEGDARARAKAHLFVNVDAEKLIHGDASRGVCEIKGVGPVPVATARELMGDALLTILVKKGVDVSTIAHDGTKAMPMAIRRAVLARDPECVVDICSAPTSDVHHAKWRSDGGEHSVHNCHGVCKWCHFLVHYRGYTLEPNGDGTYHLRAPPD